ncbi:MAG TPA: PHB depolymerase family esterase, partial [Gemmatimonadales bacterium]|nr:PHB depolymerase family esterase [Gemmatimonadales bacterium]
MKRIAAALYGLLAYVAFLLPIGYLVGFLADAGVAKTVDRGAGPLGPPLAVDLALLLGFGLQHSIMARSGFKRWIERWLPRSLERSTYVLGSGLTLALLFYLWRPIPAVLWDATGTPVGLLAWGGFAAGIGLGVAATFALSHLHLFGVAQIAAHIGGREHPNPVLRDSLLYRLVRHPMTAGLLLAFWSVPRMTVGHLVFAVGMTVYGLLGTVLEERELLRSFPDGYRAYRMEVPALVPLLRPRWLPARARGLAWELALMATGLTGATIFLLGGLRIPAGGPQVGPPLERDTLVVQGHRRSYALYDPGVSTERPLIIALHGTGGTADRLHRLLGGELERVALRRGWLVAYPEADRGRWNDCRRVSMSPAAARPDDVAFLRGLIARLVLERRVDPDKVFVLGYSGGGHMGFRMALEAPEALAAVAVFGANLPAEGDLVCDATGNVPAVLLVNGMADPVNPYRGGDVIAPLGLYLGRVRSAEESARYFERLSRDRVRLVPIPGGGHTVPG